MFLDLLRRPLPGNLSGHLTRRPLPRHLLLAVAGLAVIWILTSRVGSYNDYQVAQVGAFAVAIAGLTFLSGLNGQISLGHGGLMMVGAYATALIATHSGLSFPIVLIAATAGTAAFGAVVGVGAARLRGPYLAGATLGLALALPAIPVRWPAAGRPQRGAGRHPGTAVLAGRRHRTMDGPDLSGRPPDRLCPAGEPAGQQRGPGHARGPRQRGGQLIGRDLGGPHPGTGIRGQRGLRRPRRRAACLHHQHRRPRRLSAHVVDHAARGRGDRRARQPGWRGRRRSPDRLPAAMGDVGVRRARPPHASRRQPRGRPVRRRADRRDPLLTRRPARRRPGCGPAAGPRPARRSDQPAPQAAPRAADPARTAARASRPQRRAPT